MKKFLLLFSFSLFCMNCFSQKKSISKPAKLLNNLSDSASYSIGVNIARNLQSQGLTKIDALKLYKGLSDILLGKKPILNDENAAKCINEFVQKNSTSKKVQPANNTMKSETNSMVEADKNKVLGRAFLAENAKKPGIISMPGGWQYEILKQSDDTTRPKFEDKVTFHYTGSLIDGKIFESSVSSGNPITYNINRLIMGWQLALPMMTVGSKWKLYLPSTLAYGDNDASEMIKAGMTLIFEIELLGISK